MSAPAVHGHHITLTVPGEPQPAERARRGKGRRWYTPPATVAYRERIAWTWRQSGARGFTAGALTVSARFFISHPPSHYGTGRNAQRVRPSKLDTLPPGDLDNFLKGLLDALNGLAFADDRQVCCLSGVHKHWADEDGPRTVLDIWVH